MIEEGQDPERLLISLLARAVMPGRQHMGLMLTMILGLVGAWLGGLIGVPFPASGGI